MKLALCVLALSALTEASEPAHVALRITNGYGRVVHVAFGPVDLTAEVRVAPHEPHRYLETTWDYAPPDMLAATGLSDTETSINPALPHEFVNDLARAPEAAIEPQNGSVGSEVRNLNGELERIRQDVKLAHLEGGTFLVSATVYTDESRKTICGRASARVTVR